MYDAMIANLLYQCFDTDEDLPYLIESHVKCMTGMPAEADLILSDIPA